MHCIANTKYNELREAALNASLVVDVVPDDISLSGDH